MPRIKARVKQTLYHTIDIDSEDYGFQENMTGVCELYNAVKDDPMSFVSDTDNGQMGMCDGDSDLDVESIEVVE